MKPTSISQFIDHHYRHFNAAAMKDAAHAYRAHLDRGGKMLVTLAGAMSTAELGLSLAEMIRRDKVHAICCTGANLEEDLFNLVAQNHYERIPHYRELTVQDEQNLLRRHLNRVTDTCIPEAEAMRRIEAAVATEWMAADRAGTNAFPHQFLYRLLVNGTLKEHYQIDPADSWMCAAAERDLPMFVPGWEDSTLGNMYAAHCITGAMRNVHTVRSGVEYMMHLAKWYLETAGAHSIGFFQIGGGIAGDFPICVVPMLSQDLRKAQVPLWGYFCQIGDSTTSYGSYSGAVPNEKITWGKLGVDTPKFIIESDATIVAPLMFAYVLGWYSQCIRQSRLGGSLKGMSTSDLTWIAERKPSNWYNVALLGTTMLDHVTITKGTCFALFAYDIGLSINLTEAEQRILEGTERSHLRHKTRAPQYFEYRPAPLRLIREGSAFDISYYQVSSTVEVMVYDFGAVTITYRFPINGPFHQLLELSESLYENERLLTESRTRVEQLVQALGPAIERPAIADDVEDYIIFSIESAVPETPPLWTSTETDLAQILRAERTPFSDQEVADALSCRISFGQEDMAFLDWHSAVLFGQEMDDVRAVLEFANVELLEMRILDEQLDRALDEGYEALSRKPRLLSLPGSHEKDMTHIAQLQVDNALIFERVTNTLKLLGDQYLARVYRLISQRFHLEAWDASILRKLQTLESIYGKMSDRAGTRRMEVLEWIIIVLIALSIALSFIPGSHG